MGGVFLVIFWEGWLMEVCMVNVGFDKFNICQVVMIVGVLYMMVFWVFNDYLNIKFDIW